MKGQRPRTRINARRGKRLPVDVAERATHRDRPTARVQKTPSARVQKTPSSRVHKKPSSRIKKKAPAAWGESASSLRLVPTGGSQPAKGKPRFYGSGPIQHAPVGRAPTTRRARRRPRASGSPPVALLVGAPCALVLLLVCWLAFSGGDEPAQRGSAAPAATAHEAISDAPEFDAAPSREDERDEEPVRAERRPDAASAQDEEGEETEAEAKARLEAVDRARAEEHKWMNELEGRTAGEASE